MYNPDNPKIHCDTLQLLDNYWNGTDVNVPNQNKKPEEFAAILTEREIISNGRTVCKNPSVPNAKFTAKDAIEGETINGTCNVGYTGKVSATCQKDGDWTTNGKCLGSCTNLSNMYADSSFDNPIKSIADGKSAFSKCGNGYDGYKKYTCDNGKIKEIINTCALSMDYCPALSKENGTIKYTNSGAINSKATLECNTGYEIIGGSTTAKCNSKSETNGDWSIALGNCTPKVCSNPTTQSNANAFTKTTLKYNEEAITATCKTGYNGSISASCDESGNWKYTGNCTIVRCPTTGLTIDNGSYPTISTTNNSYNTTISGTCNTGYTGTITATCNASGVWVKSGSCSILSGCKEFSYTGSQKSFTIPSTGYTNFKVEVWGAQGGNAGAAGGKGGYGYKNIYDISGGTTINIIVGQAGQHAGTSSYGAGRGGIVEGSGCGKSRGKGGSGGGGTKVWFGNSVLQAGGGGGSGENGNDPGGAGGGANQNGIKGSGDAPANPGTVDAPGTANTNYARPGSSENGGNTISDGNKGQTCGGGGGGGHYGGASGERGKSTHSGGGGGSGYASGVFEYNVMGKQGIKTDHGFVRFCWGNNTSCDGSPTEFSAKCN